MKQYLETNDRLVVLRAVESIIDKKLELISLKEIIDMTGISRYQFIICDATKTGGYETSVLIAPRQGALFNKTVDEAKSLLSGNDKNKLRTIGYILRDLPEFREFKELYPQVNIRADFGNEVVKKEKQKVNVPYEEWDLSMHDNKYYATNRRNYRVAK